MCYSTSICTTNLKYQAPSGPGVWVVVFPPVFPGDCPCCCTSECHTHSGRMCPGTLMETHTHKHTHTNTHKHSLKHPHTCLEFKAKCKMEDSDHVWCFLPHAINVSFVWIGGQLQCGVHWGQGEHTAVERLLWEGVVGGVILARHYIHWNRGLEQQEAVTQWPSNLY